MCCWQCIDVSVEERSNNGEQLSEEELLSKKLGTLLDSAVANLDAISHPPYRHLLGSEELDIPEVRALTPSHVLQLIDGLLSKYYDVRNKFVVAVLYPVDFKLLWKYARVFPKGKLGNLFIHDLTKYEAFVPRITFGVEPSPRIFYIVADYSLKPRGAPNRIFFDFTDMPSHVEYINYPITRFVKIGMRTGADAVTNVLDAAAFSLGLFLLYALRRELWTAIIPSKCDTMNTKMRVFATYKPGTSEILSFGVVREPPCAKGSSYFPDFDLLWRFMLMKNSVF
jgi:hypothetical protein